MLNMPAAREGQRPVHRILAVHVEECYMNKRSSGVCNDDGDMMFAIGAGVTLPHL